MLKGNLRSTLLRCRAAEDREIVFGWDGMTVRVMQTRTGYVVLSLERTDTAPTQADWDKVIAAWPEAITAQVTPIPRTDGRRRALVARWPRPAEISQPA